MSPTQPGTTTELPEHPNHPSSRDPDHERIARLLQRERALRALLFGARDALVRGQVGSCLPGQRRRSPARDAAPGYSALRRRLRDVLRERIPAGALALVVSRGDHRLLELGPDRRAWHFPCDGHGGYSGHHPADSAAAIALLEEQRRLGAEFLVFPATATWWLDHYRDLATHLEARYRRALGDPETCVVYDLRAPADASAQPAIENERVTRKAPRRPFAAATIISRNYLSQARVLAKTFLQHEPGSRFYLLVVDGLPEGEELGVEATVIDPLELAIPSFYEMCFKYGIVEFNTAVKPHLLSLLFEKYGEEEVVYFDPDIMVMRPLDELRAALAAGSIVLTPHITRPLPLDGERPSERDIMISGAFNLGFLGLRRSAEAAEFLAWWQERLQDGCRIDVAQGLFTDQKWIDLVPGMFQSTVILRDLAYNVAFWNLHERRIDREAGEFLVNGRSAAFFHISGFDPEQPSKLSKHQTRIAVQPGTALAALLDLYAASLFDSGYRETSRWEYGYARFANGVRVHPLLRQIYLNLGSEERARFGDPFSALGPGSFLDWATRPSTEDGGLSPFLRTIYRSRYDLPSAFPDVRGRDRASFLKWARRWGCSEMKFEPELVRDPDDALGPIEVSAATGSAAAAAPTKSGSGNGAKPRARTSGGPPVQRAGPYDGLVEKVRGLARAALPAGSHVLVVSRGDYRLLDLGGCEAGHFPQAEDGVYGGYHPPDSAAAIAHLEALREKGAEYLLIPQTSLWWLEYYESFRRHLERRYRLVVQSFETCLIYSLHRELERPAGAGAGASALLEATP